MVRKKKDFFIFFAMSDDEIELTMSHGSVLEDDEYEEDGFVVKDSQSSMRESEPEEEEIEETVDLYPAIEKKKEDDDALIKWLLAPVFFVKEKPSKPMVRKEIKVLVQKETKVEPLKRRRVIIEDEDEDQ
jgi:hypothetical protein